MPDGNPTAAKFKKGASKKKNARVRGEKAGNDGTGQKA
jgi:hypothetical protein